MIRIGGSKFRPALAVACSISALVITLGTVRAADLSQLKVLYVGDAESSRAADFKNFLELNVGEVASLHRDGFDPQKANGFDVVLLDWPQSGQSLESRSHKSPLGPRDEWNKPAVLLGSAGLNLAVAWMAKGGSG